jgi:hypothetical protein
MDNPIKEYTTGFVLSIRKERFSIYPLTGEYLNFIRLILDFSEKKLSGLRIPQEAGNLEKWPLPLKGRGQGRGHND